MVLLSSLKSMTNFLSMYLYCPQSARRCQKAICCIYNVVLYMLTIIAYYRIQIYRTQKLTSNKASYLYWTQKSQGWGQRAKYDAQDLYLCIWQGSLTPPRDYCQKNLIIGHYKYSIQIYSIISSKSSAIWQWLWIIYSIISSKSITYKSIAYKYIIL